MVMLKDKIRELHHADAHISETDNRCVEIARLLHHAKQLISCGYRNPMTNVIQTLEIIKTAQRNPHQWERDGYVIADWFWNTIVLFGTDASVLAAFRTLLQAYDGYEPIASFYLTVPTPERRRRLLTRNPKFPRRMQRTSEEDNSTDAQRLRVAEWLQSKVPYFHIIDGTLSEDIVQNKVMSILKINCYEFGVKL